MPFTIYFDVLFSENTAFPYHYTLLEVPGGRKVEYYENKYVMGYSSAAPQSMVLKLTTEEGNIYQLDVLALVRRTDYLVNVLELISLLKCHKCAGNILFQRSVESWVICLLAT